MEESKIMKLEGWIFLVLSWTFILAMVVFCFVKVFELRKSNVTAPLDIDTEPESSKKKKIKRK